MKAAFKACDRGDVDALAELSDEVVLAELRDGEGGSLLHRASKHGHERVVDFLLSRGVVRHRFL